MTTSLPEMPTPPKVLLTRMRDDNQALKTQLQSRGIAVLELPTAELRARSTDPTTQIDSLSSIAALAFTSPHAVRFFGKQAEIAAWQSAGGLLAAVGQATAGALAPLVVDVQAPSATGAQLASQLAAVLPAGSAVGHPCAGHARPELGVGLRHAGIRYLPWPCYDNVMPTPPTASELVKVSGVDAVYLAAPSAADRLLSWAPTLRDTPLVCIGPTTAAHLQARHGVRATAVAKDPSRASVEAAIITALRRHDPQAGDQMNPKSAALFDRAQQVTPGGVHSPVRAFGSVPGDPIFFSSAAGSEVTDADGKVYTDLCMSWGPLILGHADGDVVSAVVDAASHGLSFGACHAGEVELASLIVSAFDGFDQCRFVSSGTEAVMTAIRLARGITGRPLIVKFEGGYHGHSDGLLVKAGSGLVTAVEGDTEPSSAGVPAAIASATLQVPFADLAAVEALFKAHPEDIAAVILEPMPANNGLLLQQPEFLAGLRRLTADHGSLLIFDEVISGFRVGWGGYGKLVDIQPDLVTLGKVIGGGMPVGAVVGPKALMEQLAPMGPVYQAGTLSGNPVSMAAGLATLNKLSDSAIYERLEALGQRVEDRIAAANRSWPQVQRQGSLFWLYLDDGPLPADADAISQTHVARFKELHGQLLAAGFYVPPSAYEVMFLSAAHTAAQLDQFVDAVLAHTAD
ncbi:MAG: glutamate-1-semialdehyde 2,1-aminomutase [Myxococcales bacterium]|nr:glutamate-1-semialdehyde 2,1-aminomutase [Myxococcales bacterium]